MKNKRGINTKKYMIKKKKCDMLEKHYKYIESYIKYVMYV